MSDVWTRASSLIRAQLATPIYQSWFAPIRPGPETDSSLVLLVPSKFAKEWIEPRYLPLIQHAVAEAAGRDLTVHIDVDSQLPPPAPPPTAEPTGPRDVVHPDPVLSNPRYSFETYVTGGSNRFSHAAALAVAEAPARAYNPLFIYGGVGLGKTHLLHAIGHYVAHTQPTAQVRYVSSEKFTNEFIASVGDPGRISGFKSRYRDCDVLLVDDIQFLEHKEATVEEFFHTFNTLYGAQKQIVITSDRAPKQLGLDERVRSRFSSGLITDVQPPDLETRIAILRKKADYDGVVQLSDDVLAFIASTVESNIRELEGALIRVIAFASLDRSNITVDLAQTVLQNLYPEGEQGTITPEVILAETCRYFNIETAEVLSMKRERSLVHARHVAMYLCRELTDLSLPRIGARFGGRDHSTVMHATSKIRTQMAEQRSTYNQIQELTSRVRTRAKTL